MNDSPVDCQNANGTEPQRDPLTLSAKRVVCLVRETLVVYFYIIFGIKMQKGIVKFLLVWYNIVLEGYGGTTPLSDIYLRLPIRRLGTERNFEL